MNARDALTALGVAFLPPNRGPRYLERRKRELAKQAKR